MRKILTSSTWNWITLAVALIGILSVGSLIGEVGALQSEFDHHAGWIAGLKNLERSIWELQVAALKPNSDKANWIQAESAYRNQVENLSRQVAGDRDLAAVITEVERQVNTIWGIHLGMAASEEARLAAAGQLQLVGGNARGQIHSAVERMWTAQSEAARQVAEKWLSVKDQLILCCLFAGFPAVLLRIHHLRVADRRKVEGALVESEDRYQRLVELLPDAVVVHRGGKIVYGNAALARLLREESPQALIGRSILDMMHPDDKWAAWRNWEQFRETQQHTPLMEQRMVRQDGQTVDVDFVATSFRIEEQPAVLVVIRDISERKRSADAVRKTEARFRSLFESVLEGVYRATAEGQILEANPSMVRMLGYTSIEQLRAAGDHNFARALLQPGKMPGHQEVTLRRQDGTSLVVLNHARAVQDDQGRTLHIEGTVTDVTAMKETEERLRQHARELESARGRLEQQAIELERTRDEALESSRLKSEFLANVSHEIRTPLNAMIGLSQLLLDSRLTAEQRDNAEALRGKAEFLLGLINDILDFSKAESGRLSFEHLDFSLRGTVASVMERLADRTEAEGIDLAFIGERTLPDTFKGDPVRLQQIFTKLVSRALKFTAPGEVVITGRLQERDGASATLRFAIESAGLVPREPAGQPEGVGLALVRQLVEAMGGEAGFSEPDSPEVWFTVRLACEDPAMAPSSPPAPVLIAVAKSSSRHLHRQQAESWGWKTDEASDGPELMAKLQAGPYAAVLIDAELADCDLLAIANLANGMPEGARPRLILLAPFTRRVMNDMALETRPGFASMLPRPLRQSEWQSTLEALRTTASPEPPPAPAALRILVTEDNIVNQKVAMKLINKLGYEADLATNGLEAVHMLARQTYALVLMDCQMPVLDGYAATAQIRRAESRDRHTPIVAMTAHAMKGDREKCLAAGMDDYLTKPVQISELRRAIEQWAVTPSLSPVQS